VSLCNFEVDLIQFQCSTLRIARHRAGTQGTIDFAGTRGHESG